jgi:hypothetical protein
MHVLVVEEEMRGMMRMLWISYKKTLQRALITFSVLTSFRHTNRKGLEVL